MIQSMRVVKLVCSVTLLAASVACGSDTAPVPTPLDVPFSTTDIVVGTGTEAVVGKTVRVYYTGWVYSTGATDNKGSQFDSNTAGPGITFPPIGSGQAIKGWDQGIVGMRVGGKRRIVIPPDLAYGLNPPAGSSIPVNATLIFEVELLSVAG
jgi:FKBP-type peptidyl-prolyl cis-trans isomerase